jgi:rhodanese-related sulfurtransferase
VSGDWCDPEDASDVIRGVLRRVAMLLGADDVLCLGVSDSALVFVAGTERFSSENRWRIEGALGEARGRIESLEGRLSTRSVSTIVIEASRVVMSAGVSRVRRMVLRRIGGDPASGWLVAGRLSRGFARSTPKFTHADAVLLEEVGSVLTPFLACAGDDRVSLAPGRGAWKAPWIAAAMGEEATAFRAWAGSAGADPSGAGGSPPAGASGYAPPGMASAQSQKPFPLVPVLVCLVILALFGAYWVVFKPIPYGQGGNGTTTRREDPDRAAFRKAGGEFVDVAEAKRLYDQGAPFFDARLKEEFDEGHVKDAVLLDPTDAAIVEAKTLPDVLKRFDRARPVVVYCNGGTCETSLAIGRHLIALGFSAVKVFDDGIPAWKARGYPSAKN